MKKATYLRTGEQVTILARHTDYAVPMNECRMPAGHTGLLKDDEIRIETPPQVLRVCFTYAIDGGNGLWIDTADGCRNWKAAAELSGLYGPEEYARLRKIGYNNGMCGMWMNARNGDHVYVAGVEVNP